MPWNGSARWFEARHAQNRKPATYRCPLCGKQLPALIDHMLLFPEGDHARRRHAHSACVLNARKAGALPTKDEWQRAERAKHKLSEGDHAGAGGGLRGAFRRVLRGPPGGSRPA